MSDGNGKEQVLNRLSRLALALFVRHKVGL